MRSHILFILLVFTVSGQLLAQNKDQEYFAKVPSRYVKPGLSPMQSIRLSYQQAPGNQWVKDAGELKLDLYRIKLNPRASVIISAGTWAGAKRQKHNLYEVNGSKAYEQTDYVYAAPTVSAGVSYGFFFPYFIAARFGVTKPWEAAYYKANLPILNTDGSGIKATDSEIN
ncbi:MAG TPA: hypothetical protein VK609_16760, partial [Mucilaginibacter sp.]|nr:hypothetical protein [Mucilaginibacter sp.]